MTLFVSPKDQLDDTLQTCFRQIEVWANTFAIPAILPATQQASNYTFKITDMGTVVEGTSGSAQTFTVPPFSSVPFPLGAIMEVFQYGAGQITIAGGTGVTLRSDGSHVNTAAQYATIALRQRAKNEWVLSGDLA